MELMAATPEQCHRRPWARLSPAAVGAGTKGHRLPPAVRSQGQRFSMENVLALPLKGQIQVTCSQERCGSLDKGHHRHLVGR